MKLSDKAIFDFQKIYQSIFGVGLNEEEANEKGLELLEFMQMVYREVPKKDQAFLNSLDITGLEHNNAIYK
jgi:hypothetical protein